MFVADVDFMCNGHVFAARFGQRYSLSFFQYITQLLLFISYS